MAPPRSSAPSPVASSPGAALPPFEAVFERLVARVGAATPEAEMRALHAAFEERTGAFGPDDPWFEARSRAFWDDTMTRQPAVRPAMDPLEAGEAPWAAALSRAHRGLFQASARARTTSGEVVLADLLSGAELVVHELDAASRDAVASTRGVGVFDGTVVAIASPVRVALLPGAIFHPDGAEAAIATVVTAARARGLSHGALLDALLRMELSLRTLSRVKPGYAYRAEALHG